MSCRPATGLLVASLLLGGGTRPAIGQPSRPEPRLNRAFPAGGRAGGAVEVVVGGADLAGADGLWFSASGLRSAAVADKPGVFRVAIAAGTPPGRHDIRVTTPDGVSNPRTFVVGGRPESIEVEPNDTPTAAGPIAVNSIVNGTIRPTDVDCFAFEGREGMRVFLDLDAERIESKLDATLHLLDAAGAEIANSRDAAGLDPFLDVTLPDNGRYVVRLHEVTYAGSEDHTYRLTLHEGPHLDAIAPGVAAAGSGSVPLVLIGRGLGPGGQPFAGRGSDGRPLERLGMAVAAEFGPASDLAMLAVGAAIPIRGRDVRATTGRGTSNPVVLAEAPGPVVAEGEPGGLDRPQEVVPPCTVAGTFGTPADVDVYRFRAKAGETWRIEAVAEAIGSPADPTLIVQRVDEAGGVRDVATADDTTDPGLGPWLNLATVDASLRWSVPADGAYQVAVADVAGTGRHGPAVGYRLAIRRESPDVRLFVVPTTPSVPGATTVRRGASATVIAWRREGFTGPIWVRATTLPEGVRTDPVVIAEGRTSATIVFEASPEAPISTGAIGLVGEASTLGPPPGPLPPRPGPRSVPNLVRPVIPAVAIWPISRANPNNRTTVAPARATRGLVLAVRDGAPFRLSARPVSPVAVAGKPIDIEVTADRLGGFVGPIVVGPGDLPGAVAPASVTIAEGATSARLAWTPPAGLAPGIYSFAVRGTATIRPDSKSAATFSTNEPSNTFPIAVRSP